MALKSLAALILEACEVARDCGLSGAELSHFAQSMADGWRVEAQSAVESCEEADAIAAVVVGDAPAPGMTLCACNHRWVHPDGTHLDFDSRGEPFRFHRAGDCGEVVP